MSMQDEPIMSYPDGNYTLDYPNQLRMDRIMTRRTRITGGLLVASAAVLVGFALTRWQPLGYAWFPLMLVGVLHGIFRRTPALPCTNCGQRMRREMVASGADEEEFLVCTPCQRYTFNHRRSVSG